MKLLPGQYWFAGHGAASPFTHAIVILDAVSDDDKNCRGLTIWDDGRFEIGDVDVDWFTLDDDCYRRIA